MSGITFNASAFLFDPSNPALTTVPIFFTRWVTNFCAPAFSFLAGLSAFFVGRRKEKKELSSFLLKRGLWLIFIEMTVVNFGWYFDVYFKTPGFLVIWALGISMVILSALVYLPQRFILIFSVVVIFGHNLLDPLPLSQSILGSLLHGQNIFTLAAGVRLYIDYPIIPWAGVMALGYCFGELYGPSFDPARRKRILTMIGLASIALFVVLRTTNIYGDPVKWREFDTPVKTFLSFLAVTKYPVSLCYLLVTLGPALLFLAASEHWSGKIAAFFTIFGRVPFFFYILHLFLIHIIALIVAEATGFGWRLMILPDWITSVPALKGYGFDLWVVFLIWVVVVALLYPVCKWFDAYKAGHREKWWLSYL